MNEVENRGTRVEKENNSYELASFDHFKSEVLSELKRLNYSDVEDMAYRLQLTYDKIIDILDVENISGSAIGYALPPALYKISDFNLMFKSLLPKEVKVYNKKMIVD